MLNREAVPKFATLKLRTEAVAAWVSKWHETTSGDFWATIKANELDLYSVSKKEWLATVAWSSEKIVVTEREGSSLHRFSGMKPALMFLDAVLQHYVIVNLEVAVSCTSQSVLANPTAHSVPASQLAPASPNGLIPTECAG
jgi:hypothetical protein